MAPKKKSSRAGLTSSIFHNDILLEIFSFLGVRQVGIISQVCTQWQECYEKSEHGDFCVFRGAIAEYLPYMVGEDAELTEQVLAHIETNKSKSCKELLKEFIMTPLTTGVTP